jgi:hypothetical protein
MRSLPTMMASAMLLSGCAATLQPEHWSKSGANQETFMKDYTTCRNQTLEDQYSFYKGDPLLTCMETRGYKRPRSTRRLQRRAKTIAGRSLTIETA